MACVKDARKRPTARVKDAGKRGLPIGRLSSGAFHPALFMFYNRVAYPGSQL
jgi:hypothetical protein